MGESLAARVGFQSPADREHYPRECLAEGLKFGWYLLVTLAFSIAISSSLGVRGLGPAVLLEPRTLLGIVGVAAVLAVKPLWVGEDLQANLGGKWLLRSGSLLVGLLTFGTFAARLFAADLDDVPHAVGALAGTVVDPGSNPLPIVVYGLSWAVVVLSFGVGFGAATGAVVGAVASFLLGGPTPLAGGLIGAGLGALLFQSVIFLDVRQVDRGGIGIAALALVGVLFLAPAPRTVVAVVPLAAALGSGYARPNEDLGPRSTNGLVALRDRDGPERIPGYGGQRPGRLTDEEPSYLGLIRFAYGYVLRDRAGNGTANSALAATIVALVSPLFLFVPLLWVAGYVFRCCGAAAHGHDDVPAFTYAGRRALLKEGAAGLAAVAPFALIPVLYLPTILVALGGDAVRAATAVGDAYATVGLPTLATGGAAVGAVAWLAFALVAPAILVSYAVDGRIRGALDPRRIADVVGRKAYPKYLLAQVAIFLVPVVVAAAGVAVVLGVAAVAPGPAVGLAGVGVAFVVVAFVAFVPFVSAALWGGYWHWRSFEYDPTPVPDETLLRRLLGLAEGDAGLAGLIGTATATGDSDGDDGRRRLGWSSIGGSAGTGSFDDDAGASGGSGSGDGPESGASSGSGDGSRRGTGSGSGEGSNAKTAGSESGGSDSRADDALPDEELFERHDEKWREAGGRFEYGVKRPSGSYRYFDDREDAAAALRDWYEQE